MLIKDGTFATLGTFGHVDTNRTTPVTPHTLCRVGSVSKTVTSLLVLALVEDEHLTLTTPVSTLLPAAARLHGWQDDLRLVHLLEHTDGLLGSSFYEYARTGLNVSPTDYLARMQDVCGSAGRPTSPIRTPMPGIRSPRTCWRLRLTDRSTR